MRNVKIDEVDRLDREVVALGNDYAQGYILPPHQHRRAQLLYGATGLMYVTTQDGEWVVPPQHAVWIPPETVHAVRFVGVTTRSLYIEPYYVAAFIKHRRCEVISVSPLALCQAFLLNPSIHDPAARWARALFMSQSTFRRHFLKQLGLSFSAWRQRACVVSALAWLIAGKPVNEVALSLGYDNASSFATMFRRVTGQPPSFYHPA